LPTRHSSAMEWRMTYALSTEKHEAASLRAKERRERVRLSKTASELAEERELYFARILAAKARERDKYRQKRAKAAPPRKPPLTPDERKERARERYRAARAKILAERGPELPKLTYEEKKLRARLRYWELSREAREAKAEATRAKMRDIYFSIEYRKINRERMRVKRGSGPRPLGYKAKLEALAIFREKGCASCGETDPACLDAHHPDVRDKEFSISYGLKCAPYDSFVGELLKCICLCALCHRKAHRQGIESIPCNPQKSGQG
jgi:hypothetical protein